MNNSLSERIAFLRKERGLTQEQLGQLVGVSAQAVSKWEKGGAPDVELLPSLADHLGVTMDGLFGRDDAQIQDFPQQMSRWLDTLPVQERMYRMMRLLAANIISLCTISEYSKAAGTLFTSSCYSSSGEREIWMRALACTEWGMVLGVLSEDFPLYLLLPEPPQGYGAHFASDEEYRRLFSVLGREGSLEILRYLHGQEEHYYTSAALARRAGIPLQTAEDVIGDMEVCHLLTKSAIETEDGSVSVYALHNNCAFVPFLYFARWLMEEHNSYSIGWSDRERPILAPSRPAEEDPHETKH